MTKKISLIIPAYNEEKNIKRTVDLAVAHFESLGQAYEIIVSDDGSKDKTVAIVEELAQKNNLIRLLKNDHQGKAVAIGASINYIDGEYCLLMDADGATRINQLTKLRLNLEENNADVAIGSREISGARRLKEPLYRHLLGRGFNTLVKLITGLKFQDTQCGFKLFKTSVLKKLSQKSTIMNRKNNSLTDPLVTAFDVELLILAKINDYKIVEVPIEWSYMASQNVNPLKDSLRMFFDVLKIRWNLRQGKYLE